METKQVKITVKDADKFPIADLWEFEPTQGELKSLSKENFEKLKQSILKEGYFVPMFVWKNKNKLNVLDGHQRLRTLKHLKEQDGFVVPRLPYVEIAAKTMQEAKRKLLLITSAYGKIEKDGLYEFIQGLNETDLVTDYALPEINAGKFLDEYFNDPSNVIPEVEPEFAGTLKSVGGNGVKMLQLFFSEKDHQHILKLIASLQEKFETENATDTVKRALEYANDHSI